MLLEITPGLIIFLIFNFLFSFNFLIQKLKIKKIKNLRFEAWPQETKKQKTEAFILLNLLYVSIISCILIKTS